MRTTVDLDPVILHEAKERAAEEGKTLGRLSSELLAPALKRAETTSAEHKEAVRKVLDER